MENPLVSILVPIYGVQQYLRQCVDSLCSQTYDTLEIVLIDDGSPDDCAAIVDEYAEADNRIRAIHKPNSGYGDSLNQGLEIAHGSWVAIAEPDDWVDPSMIERLMAVARANEQAGSPVDLVKGAYWRVINAPDTPPREEPCIHLDLVKPPHQPFSIDECPALLSLHPSIWSALYRRSFLDEFGIRFHPIPGAGWADNPFFIETMVAARALAWIDEPIYHYREFEDGTLSHLGDWRTIVDRWSEMNDVLRRYDAEAPVILQAHACRGCAYLQMLFHDFDQNDPELRAAEQSMADSLDFDIVKASPYIPAEYKRAYARFLPLRKQVQLFF